MIKAANLRSRQVQELWNAAVISILVQIWKARNRAHFDGTFVNCQKIKLEVLKNISLAGLLTTGSMHNNCNDFQLLRNLNVKGRPRPAQNDIQSHASMHEIENFLEGKGIRFTSGALPAVFG
ncbi:hypothetical protein FRX31_015216 [Thalictrum thalictroides]|uniref:Uncharacterized protein n=1 Tax=Thalictrum thalictroides TaxID=46969 RepID=A0A7J6WCU6_THATH|nr:hypothetical protein FRX31_015216 [Thalictrum thalictroides]